MAKLKITWPQFAVCNDNPQKAFEDMCRRLFTAEYLRGKKRPHVDHNIPGVEVLPILEPERDDGKTQKRISFQCKYAAQPSAAYSEFQKSARQTVKYHKGSLDLVYLFCNKTLTTTSRAYQAIVKIHKEAGIETEPISNDELLDMVSDYQDIAECFFQPRIVADTMGFQPAMLNGIPVYFVTTNQSVVTNTEQPANSGLLNELVSEKLSRFKRYAVSLELDTLRTEVEKLISDGADDGELYYYQLLTLLHAGKDTTEVLGKCAVQYRAEADWLVSYYKSPYALSVEEYKKHTPITQIFAVDKLFTPEHWGDIIGLKESFAEANVEIDDSIKTQFDLHYGLSLLNLRENEKAKAVLEDLYERTKEQRMFFYSVCADIRIENAVYQTGLAGHHDVLKELVDQLDMLKELKHYKQQELFVAALKMEAYYHLGFADSSYLECAIDEYTSYTETTRNNTIIRYYDALCLEMNREREKAIEVYNTLDWLNDLAIAERYMICLVLADQPEKAVDVYNSLEQKAVRTEAVYLFALEQSDSEKYIDELNKAVKAHGDNLKDFLQIAYFTDSEKPARDIVVPVIRNLISEDALHELLLHEKVELTTFLAHCKEIELLEIVLRSIDDVPSLNSFAAGEIYKSIFQIANREYSREEDRFEVPVALDAAERIADMFLAGDAFRRNFLQIKVLCAGAKRMPFSSLKYSKELFELTHDEETARNIVALLFDRKEANPAIYEPYLEVLKQSENPEHSMVVASAMLMQGKEEVSDFYAYKALYLLNGVDDYNVYRSYFALCNYNLHRFSQEPELRTVKGAVVVTLEEEGVSGTPQKQVLCLDPEADFADEANRSMGIAHITSTNPDYIKLRGSGLHQVLKLRDKKYKIIGIMSRGQYGLVFIFRKMQEKPEMFKGSVWMISTEDVDEMVKKIKELTDNSKKVKSLLSAYHFDRPGLGIPVDAVAFGDYGRYISALKYLLFQKDEAFYAGQPVFENEEKRQYVPGLATLILLAIIGRLDILDAFKDRLMIPKSYMAFFQNEFAKAAGRGQLSTSTLYFVEDKPVMQEGDNGDADVWEATLNYCRDIRTQVIRDQERIDFKITEGLNGERFITGANISSIHLDALILAQREKATFLCDDLFFRKIATAMGVRNLNIVSLIYHYSNPDYMVPIIKELSKTNYIFIHPFARNDEEFKEVLGYLLDGERKIEFYEEYIRRFIEIKDRVLREHFGDELIDKLYEGYDSSDIEGEEP